MEELGHLSDGEVVERSHADPEVFGELFRRHHVEIFAFVARRSGRDSAADLTAETFTRAFAIRQRFDPSHESARPWLMGIAANVVGDQLRRWSVRRRKHALGAVRLLGRPDDPFDQALSDLSATDLGEELAAALERLPSGQRAPLVLFSVDGLSYGEIAELLELPVGTVRSRIHRAKATVRNHLSEEAKRFFEAPESTGGDS